MGTENSIFIQLFKGSCKSDQFYFGQNQIFFFTFYVFERTSAGTCDITKGIFKCFSAHLKSGSSSSNK